MRRLLFILLILAKTASAQNPLKLRAIEVARGFVSPIGLCAPADGSGRIFVTEQGGKVKIMRNGQVLPDPFLDITAFLDGLNVAYSEKGLLGLAFHPDYKNNRRFFVYYSAKTEAKGMDHKSVLAEFHASTGNADLADVNSRRVILEIQEPESNHNGGQLAFGPDGYLYIGVGDGGGAGDKHGETGNGQDYTTMLGKILRIDVNGEQPYSIPPDNPFVNMKGIRPEIWATGLRNPWRFSFDRATKKLFCGDVGQNKWEEIDIIEKGQNYGWRIMEGGHCFNPEEGCDRTGLRIPVAEYEHSEGICVIGGYVYRGMEFPSLHGYYIFGDWSGRMWYLKMNEESRTWYRGDIHINDESNDLGAKINSFGEDEKGNIYIVCQKLFGPKSPTGVIYKISY